MPLQTFSELEAHITWTNCYKRNSRSTKAEQTPDAERWSIVTYLRPSTTRYRRVPAKEHVVQDFQFLKHSGNSLSAYDPVSTSAVPCPQQWHGILLILCCMESP